MKKPTHFIIVDDDAINNTMCRFSISKHFADAEIHTYENPEIALTEIAKGKISTGQIFA